MGLKEREQFRGHGANERSVLCIRSLQVGGTWWVVINIYSVQGKGGSEHTDVRSISI